MTEPKLKAKLFVHAAIRRCSAQAIPVVVARRGDEDAGTILVRVYRGGGLYDIWSQARDAKGTLGWLKASGAEPVPEDRAESYVTRARDVDWDLWVLDVDSLDGTVPFIDHVIPANL
ncbi:MAG: DUF1491 family protein [Alphaproteobacteria bacterium]|nr:DUF1491 family protein [Alphaproteobacteria bacterium]